MALTMNRAGSDLDEILDRLSKDGWSCGWHTVRMQDGSQQVVIEGKRKNVTLIWRWDVATSGENIGEAPVG